jgi:hypothetical protein
MAVLIVCSVLLLGLLLVAALLSLLREWAEHSTHDGPIVHDQGPIFHDQAADYRGSRSQFAWQSRSHFRGPD